MKNKKKQNTINYEWHVSDDNMVELDPLEFRIQKKTYYKLPIFEVLFNILLFTMGIVIGLYL